MLDEIDEIGVNGWPRELEREGRIKSVLVREENEKNEGEKGETWPI